MHVFYFIFGHFQYFILGWPTMLLSPSSRHSPFPYLSGGAAAEFQPLSKHLLEYEWALAQYLGYGVAACYRGPQLYDTNETMVVVQKWVNFYKAYRDILISDIVHVRRPDMQGK